MRRSGSGSTFSEWNISLFQWRSLRSLLSNRIASARSQSPNMYSALFAIALFIAAWPIDGIDAKVSKIQHISKSNCDWICALFARQAEFNIIGTKAVCSKESELVHNVTCGLKTVNRTASLWSMDVYFGDGVVLDSIYVSETFLSCFFFGRRASLDDHKSPANDFNVCEQIRPCDSRCHCTLMFDWSSMRKITHSQFRLWRCVHH